MIKIFRRLIPMVAALVVASTTLVACTNAATTTASCAFVVGSGGAYDANLHAVYYPGQAFNTQTGESVHYVPCNSRNYIINPLDANGHPPLDASNHPIGDRHTPIEANTSKGTPIIIWARVLWTLNEDRTAMGDFYQVCAKYNCWSDKDISGSANFATDGWNGMLGENFGPAMDKSGQAAAIQFDDSIWQTPTPDQKDKLATAMAADFEKEVEANLGFNEDLFCGSGNSRWTDPNNPGKGKFDCSQVRITVDSVQLKPVQGDQSSQNVKALNVQRLENAKALYGDDAGNWLGLQDTIDKCGADKAVCVINIGGNGAPPAVAVPLQSSSPAPSPTAKATPKASATLSS